MDLSIVIPIYNEEALLKNSIEQIYNFLKENDKITSYEVICVDDGSKDSTRQILESSKSLYPNLTINQKRPNRGKGFSVKEGIQMATKDYVLFFDADLSTPLPEINNFIDEMNSSQTDIIIGSRNISNSKTERSFKRTLISKTFAILKKLICNIYYQDTQCGFKFFKTNVAKDIFSKVTIDGFTFDVEMLVIAKNKGYKIKEKPIEWVEAKTTSLNIFKQVFKMLSDLFYIRKNIKKGLYN